MNIAERPDDVADFQGVPTDFAAAYHDARLLMGTKGTDLTELTYHVGLLYVNAPDKWVVPYQALIQEIGMRATMLATLQLPSVAE